jgi:uncharacterized protein with GYD domain
LVEGYSSNLLEDVFSKARVLRTFGSSREPGVGGILLVVGKEPDPPEKGGRKEEDKPMPLYMTQFTYTSEAWATLTDNPEDRSVAMRELLEAQGGRLLGWYLSFGEYDGLVIYEAPDEATAGAVVLAAARHGHLRATKTTPLFTSEESMAMMRRAGATAFRAPRQLR